MNISLAQRACSQPAIFPAYEPQAAVSRTLNQTPLCLLPEPRLGVQLMELLRTQSNLSKGFVWPVNHFFQLSGPICSEQ